MRLLTLDLQRYGHLSDTTLAFPADAALCVVYGANEAGKSTALSAIGDALYGIHERSRYAFLHQSQLRIGFTLAARDGTEATFVRRKGRGNTLLDQSGAALPESALLRFTGGNGRDVFETMFGLNGERLRAGGTTLGQLGGAAGESLLAAGMGANLRAILERIEEEAKKLHGDGRGRRVVAVAADAFRQAQREIDARAVLPRDWQDTERAHAAAKQRLAVLQDTARRLDAESNRLERVRRIAPILSQLDTARATVAELADTPVLPADAEATLRLLVKRRDEARRDAARETAEAARLTVERDALVRSPELLAVQDAIDELDRRRGVVVQAMEDLPKRRIEVAGHRSAVAEAVADLGIPLDAEAARDAVPSAGARKAVQRLHAEHGKLAARTEAATKALSQGEARRARAEAAVQALPLPPDTELLRATLTSVRSRGPLDEELARRELRLSADRARCDTALAALPLWTGDAASLAACVVPLPASIAAATQGLDAAEEERRAALRERDGLVVEIAACDEQIAQLARGETVPTPAAVAEARARRDDAWRALRRFIDGGGELADLPATFEALRDEADRLSDRRADDAQRVADFLAATIRRDSLSTRLQRAEHRCAQATRGFDQAEAAWRALWAPAGIMPQTPAAMKEWLRSRAEVLKLREAMDETDRERGTVLHARDAARQALIAVMPELAADPSLGAMLARAEAACSAGEKARDAYRKAQEALARETDALPELRREVEDARVAQAGWQTKWGAAVAAIGLAAECAPELADAALGAWTRIAEKAATWRDGETRIAEMTATIATFERDVGRAQSAIGEPASDEPAQAIAARLSRKLADARKAEAQATDLAARIAQHETAAREAGERAAGAESELATLRTLAGAEDDAALEAAIAQSSRKATAQADAARCAKALAAQGDGRDEAALREEAAATDPDSVFARLAAIRDERHDCDMAREHATEERTRCEAVLTDMQRGHDAAAAAQQAKIALADAAAAAERYARLHIARTLLRSGIERFRKNQQGPLLRAAGRHFATLTQGRYVSLIAEEDGGKTVIQAVRDTGTECPLDALSEGTRDQLYLALRAASVEAHAAHAEPLPFIADDLLVHFDDRRAAAAIRLLAAIDRTQAILFTHHDHVVDLAEDARADGASVTVIRLPNDALAAATA